jgi:hypothetical protein
MDTSRTLIKLTQDGRRVEVIDRAICLDGRHEADTLIEVRQHPNRIAIRQAAPDATHMAGRIPLNAEEAARARAALEAARALYDATPLAIAERIRHAADDILKLRIDE